MSERARILNSQRFVAHAQLANSQSRPLPQSVQFLPSDPLHSTGCGQVSYRFDAVSSLSVGAKVFSPLF